MSQPSLAIGITGTRCSGKDTLARHLYSLNRDFISFSLANDLKEDLADFIARHYGLDVFSVTGKDKELIRPFLVAHGMGMRHVDPEHWIKRVAERITSHVAVRPRIMPILTDVRFRNEASFFRSAYKDRFVLISVTREGAPEPTEEEQRHHRDVEGLADYRLHWGGDTEEGQLARAHDLVAWLKERGLMT